ncbi:MAG: SLC13 family permease [Verrucomicrobiales bacterium]|jgi:di/tricarboxylate transporter|nr:SLC13 family permease [Verrucomicrobiales bacterium]
MTADFYIILGLLAVTITLFALGKPRMDAVALVMLVVLPFTGVLDVKETLAGFADPNVILIAALFVVGEGLVRTGVAQKLGDLLVTHAGRNETRLMLLLMFIVAVVGSVMSSTGVVAIFIPVVLRICRNARLVPGRLMMPLSVAALISGMMTLVATTPNLVVHGELVRNGFAGFKFFSFTPYGVPMLVLAAGYMLVARNWLVKKDQVMQEAASKPRMTEWLREYALSSHRLQIAADSPLAGRNLGELGGQLTRSANVVVIERANAGRFASRLVRPEPQTVLQAGDVLLIDWFDSSVDAVEVTKRLGLVELPLASGNFTDVLQEFGMAEVMLPATSRLAGSTIRKSKFRTKYELTVLGLKHGRVAQSREILREPLRIGDTLLVFGPWENIRKLQADMTDLIVLTLPAEAEDVVLAASRAPLAILSLAVMVLLMVSGIVPNVLAALIACLLMGLFGCIDMNSSYRSIHWQSLILIVGMLPFSLALQKTGGIDWFAYSFIDLLGNAQPRFILAGLFIITALLGLFISNTATAVLMAPVALALAAKLQLSPQPFAMTVALAASAAFMTPVSSPVNTLVVGPGNYRFGDFVRVGVPLALLALAVSVLLVPWLLPF